MNSIMANDITLPVLVITSSIIVAFYYVYYLYKKIGAIDVSKFPKAVEISNDIRLGSMAFLKRQYTTVIALSIPVAAIIFFGFWQIFPTPGIEPIINATFVTISFLIGSIASLIAGYIAMDISTRANVRAAVSADESIGKSLRVGFDGGLVMGMAIVAMSLLGVFGLFISVFLFNGFIANPIPESQFPLLLIGLGFGASYTALFAQLGGGIFTKAADMGADLVGKIEAGIPEDDPRNPGVIADNVGDMVGDCAGRGADLFESATAENIGAMIIAIIFYGLFGIIGFLFPLVLRAGGIFATVLGQYFVKLKNEDEHPMKPMFRGLYATTIFSIIAFFILTFLTLGQIEGMGDISSIDGVALLAIPRWIWLFLAGTIGILSSLFIGWITEYYTGKHKPVHDIVEASKSGYATNMLSGFSLGLESTLLPILVLVVTVLVSYWLGYQWIATYDSDLVTTFGGRNITAYEGGVFGTAVATMGILATTGYILAMDGYGPISDNAGGIVEMSGMPESVRARTDSLDIVGNTTKALTKGFAIASAALAAFLLFEAYLTVLVENNYGATNAVISEGVKNAEIFADRPLMTFANPILILGGFIGALTVYIFTAKAIRAVSQTAEIMIQEIRRQFREIPGLMEGTTKPDYAACVDIATKNALKNMVTPGLIVVVAPILTGFILGPDAAAAFLIFGTISGLLMGLMLNNSGGAYDNAKKLIEENESNDPLLGKGTEAHKAAVVGDTIGDPFKDTAGPSIHVLIKLINNILLTFAGLFISFNLVDKLF
jgi:K(+)-stimulated pyrophosphate-energized sodium pump